MQTVKAALSITTLALVMPTLAHHSDSGYDHESLVAFQGTVSRFVWRNPHVSIFVETTNETGQTIEWAIETGSTPIMRRSGWTRDSLVPGDEVFIRAHPERDSGRSHALLLSLETSNGETLAQVEGNDVESTFSASGISGVWKGLSTPAAIFGRNLSNHPLTEKAVIAKAQHDPLRDGPEAECIAVPSPRIVTASVVYLTEIELHENSAVIKSEFFDVERTVFMDGREHPEDGEQTNQGHSIGWWEGNTLVVDTTHFEGHPSGNGPGVPSGTQKHVIERYTLSENGKRLVIDIFLEDAEYLAKPFTGVVEWNYRPDLQLFRYNCDPELSRQFLLG